MICVGIRLMTCLNILRKRGDGEDMLIYIFVCRGADGV